MSHRVDSDIPALYLPEGLSPDSSIALAPDEAQHGRALRLRAGGQVLLLDGRGSRAHARIEHIDKRSMVVRTASVVFDGAENGPYIALSFGLLADKSRLEWCIEKGVELGVREFLPVSTERSEGRLAHNRLERVAVAALKQSQRSWLPTIAEPETVTALAARRRSFERLYVCHESAPLDRSLARRLIDDAPSRVLVAIGPEGGFSDREIEELASAGGEIVSLGGTRLRAETAAIVAVALVASHGAEVAHASNDHGQRFNPGIE